MTNYLLCFYSNGEAVNEDYGVKVYIVVDTSMLFVSLLGRLLKTSSKIPLNRCPLPISKIIHEGR